MTICATSQANGYRETEAFGEKVHGDRSPSNDACHDNPDDVGSTMESNAVAMDTTVTDALEGKLQTIDYYGTNKYNTIKYTLKKALEKSRLD